MKTPGRKEKKSVRDALVQRVRRGISETHEEHHPDGRLKRSALACRESFVGEGVPIHLVDQVFKLMVREGRLYGRPIVTGAFARLGEWNPKVWRVRRRDPSA